MNPIDKKWKLFEADEKDIVYNAIVLDNDSINQLREIFPPIHPNEYYHHITMNFGVKQFPDNLGDLIEFKVIGYAEDEKGQAVAVDTVYSSNPIPHITLSCAEGVKPFYSNELLKNGYEKIKSFSLYGIINSYTKRGWIH